MHNLVKLHPNIMEILLIDSRNLLSKTHTLLLAFAFFPLHACLSTGSTGQLHLDFLLLNKGPSPAFQECSYFISPSIILLDTLF